MRSRWSQLALILAAAATLGGCTGSDAGPPSPTTGASTSAGATTQSAQAAEAAKVAQEYLQSRHPAALASVRGQVLDGDGTMVPGSLDLLSVQAGATSTAVRVRMSTDQADVLVSSRFYQIEGRTTADLSGVALLAPQANLRLLPGIWSGSEPASDSCTCSRTPDRLGPEGVELSVLYPDLPASVTQIQLKVPGFPAVSAPVTRS